MTVSDDDLYFATLAARSPVGLVTKDPILAQETWKWLILHNMSARVTPFLGSFIVIVHDEEDMFGEDENIT